MGRERILVREKKLDPDTCPIIVGAIKKTTPRIQHVKSKERIKVKTSRGKLPTNRGISTCEVFGNVMKLCVNLMPALASAQEPEQSESKDNPQKQGKKEGGETFFRRGKKTTAGNNIDSSGSTLKQKIINTSDSFSGLSLNRAAVTKQPRRPSMLPPKPQSLSLPVCWDKIQRFPKPLPPIGCSETTIPPYLTAKIDEVDEGLTGQLMDSKFWMDNILFSKSVSTRLYFVLVLMVNNIEIPGRSHSKGEINLPILLLFLRRHQLSLDFLTFHCPVWMICWRLLHRN